MPKTIGIIGGTDSSGGSGLGADQQTISAHGYNAVSVISAITFQNSSTHITIHPIPSAGLRSQLNSLLDEELDAVKIGMLPDLESVEEVVRFLNLVKCDKIILDPVKETSSGHKLISDDGWICLRDQLLPEVHLITPNIEEAHALLGLKNNLNILPLELAQKCLSLGSQSVLLKGGHLENHRESIDFLVSNQHRVESFHYRRIENGHHVRGTGCRLASSIACLWAKENDLPKGVKSAGEYIQNYIKQSLPTQGFSD